MESYHKFFTIYIFIDVVFAMVMDVYNVESVRDLENLNTLFN